jgi:hypothetical protein
VFVIFVLCIVLSVYVLFCVLYYIVLCIVVSLLPGTYPLAVDDDDDADDNNNNHNKCISVSEGVAAILTNVDTT